LDVATPRIRGYVPGRIELLGKHVDYAGGRSIVCAIDRGIAFVAQPRADALVRINDVAGCVTREVALAPDAGAHVWDWDVYVAAVARRLARDASARVGVDMAFASDLPPASGLSSSSALVIAIFLALAQCNHWFAGTSLGDVLHDSPVNVADYVAAIESGRPFMEFAGDAGVGTLGGSQDHAAILCSRAGMLSRFAFLPTRQLGDIPFDANVELAVAFSGVHAPKATEMRDAYNRASRAVTTILEILNARAAQTWRSLAEAVATLDVPQIATALSTPLSPDFAPGELIRRVKQFVIEADVHERASTALLENNFTDFRREVARSQRAASELLGNQIRETEALVRFALDSGALAASAFGAGFGGSVWAMVPAVSASRMLAAWRELYSEHYPLQRPRAEFFVTRPSVAARYIA
jgi:galactokinase